MPHFTFQALAPGGEQISGSLDLLKEALWWHPEIRGFVGAGLEGQHRPLHERANVQITADVDPPWGDALDITSRPLVDELVLTDQ